MRGERLVALGVVALAILGATAAQVLLRQDHPGSDSQSQAGQRSLATVAAASTRQTLVAANSASQPATGPSGSFPTATPVPVLTPSGAPGASEPSPTRVPPTATPLPPPTATPTWPAKTGGGQPPAVGAAFVAVVDEDSGQLLYDKGAHQRVAPASLTKIATALVALERGNPQARVRVSFDATELVDSTLMGLRIGDEVTLEDLLYGLMLPSGNDAALAIAEHVAGSKARFIEMMNERVRELGLKNTQFRNPHGLDQEGHYSSAYDVVMLARYGMQRYPLFARVAGARSWTVRGSRPYELYNLNKFLSRYEGADGVKIGYTEAAGRTIVASAKRKGHRVYVGLMRSADLVGDTVPLFDYVFANYTWPQ